MSPIVGILVAFAFFMLFRSIFGDGDSVNTNSHSQSDKDIERLREIAEYDRWEKTGRDKES